MGALSGALGIILAVPLLAILIILVDELYVQRINTAEDLQPETTHEAKTQMSTK
jgi:predicted PurR-regulated permease PerM